MATINGPLLSLGASGTIAKTATFSKWKGRAYVRQRVIPANPQTVDQTKQRTLFSFVQAVYKLMPPLAQAPWELFATGQVLTGRNAISKVNLPLLYGAADLSTFKFSPGAKGGLIASSMIPTGGANQISVALTEPALPSGWTITQAVAACIENEDPDTSTFYTVTAGFDASTPYAVVLSGLKAATEYQVGGWFEFMKPDGTTAYGPSLEALESTS